jgi:hypothetical protein
MQSSFRTGLEVLTGKPYPRKITDADLVFDIERVLHANHLSLPIEQVMLQRDLQLLGDQLKIAVKELGLGHLLV